MPKKTGFTLIELLIVVSIIAVLAAVGLTTYITFIKNARDAKRQSDLKFVQSALEQYHADQKYYPGSLDFSVGFALTNATGVSPMPTVTKTYLNNVPIGPIGISEYLYKSFKTDGSACSDTQAILCVKYCLYAKGENLQQMTDLCPNQAAVFTIEVTSP